MHQRTWEDQRFLGSYKQAQGLAEHLLSVPAKSHLPVKPGFQAYPLPPNRRPILALQFSALLCFIFSNVTVSQGGRQDSPH